MSVDLKANGSKLTATLDGDKTVFDVSFTGAQARQLIQLVSKNQQAGATEDFGELFEVLPAQLSAQLDEADGRLFVPVVQWFLAYVVGELGEPQASR